jgi:hypothetical protein
MPSGDAKSGTIQCENDRMRERLPSKADAKFKREMEQFRGLVSIVAALNRASDITERRPWWKGRLVPSA